MSPSENRGDEVLFREVTNRFWILQLITEIRRDGIYVRFEPLQRSFRRISVEQIQDISVTSYSATSYAGWHWGVRRTPGGNTVYRLQGGRGVEVALSGGEQWFIGSQRPKDLKEAIDQIHNSEA